MDDILRYVDEHLNEYVEQFRTYLRFPSVAAQQRGQEVCAKWLCERLTQAGFKSHIEPTKGAPVVMADREQPGAARRLLVYGHYDVQPAEPLEEWHHDPFGAEIADGRVYARGAVDEKGGSLATLIAAEAFLKVRGNLPVNMRFAVEGEEEIGSTHLGQWAEDHVDFLKDCHGSLTLDGSVNRFTGRPQINPGWRAGILAVELHSRGANQDLYSAEAHYIPNAAWRLVWALSTLKNEKEEILIDGWYDDLLRPTEHDKELIREFPFDAAAMAKKLGLKELLLGRQGHDPLIARWYEPTCSICGIQSGYTGKGMMTKVPCTAFAKVDFRLKTGMNPERHVALLRKHLDKHGFSDIEIKVLTSKYTPDKTPLDSWIVKATSQAAAKAFGVPPLIFPEVDVPNQYPKGSYWALGPGSLVELGTGVFGALGIPWVECYYGDPESYNHAPNEFLSIEAFRRAIHYAARTIELFATV